MDLQSVANWLLQSIGTGVALALLGIGAFKWFGKKWTQGWIEQRFAKQLETMKHEHQKELENVRHAIQSMFSRISKIHEKEFDVLPKAWFMLHEAHGAAANAFGLRPTFLPDLAKLPDDKVEEFLTESGFSQTQKNDVRLAQNRRRVYREIRSNQQSTLAEEKRRLLNNFIIEQRIFFTADLDTLFTNASGLIFDANDLHCTGKQDGHRPTLREASAKLKELDAMLPAIQKAIQKRLCYEAATTPSA